MFANTAIMQTAGLAAAASVSERDTSETAAPGLCISNFSKNDCEGVVEPGFVEFLGGCSIQDCRAVRVTDAVYQTRLKSSGLSCGQSCESRCDEFPDGRLTLKFDYVVRTDTCCPYRGSWTGEWEFVTDAGRRYAGTAHGTIGVGTNRESDCLATHDACEPCSDVELQGSQWAIGIEGSFRGNPVFSTSPTPDELNFTADGTWLVSAVSNNPFNEAFRVYNRFDGAFLDYCP